MKTTIGKFDAATGTVPATFLQGGVRHQRAVNACLDQQGGYDAKATKARVAEVAAGVAHKIEIGVIGGDAAE